MESKPLSIQQILQRKPDATVGDVPHIRPIEKPITDSKEVERICLDIDRQIQQLENDYAKILERMASLFPKHPDIASTVDDLDPSHTIQKLQKVKAELQRLL